LVIRENKKSPGRFRRPSRRSVEWSVGEHSTRVNAAKEGSVLVAGDPGRDQIRVKMPKHSAEDPKNLVAMDGGDVKT